MAWNSNQVIDILNNLIETSKDRQFGYRTAMEAVEDSGLKSLFHSYEQRSAAFATELQNEVRRLGGDPEKGGSVAGWFMRGWMNIRAAVTGGDEVAIVTECERGEDSAVNNYENALKEMLPADIRAIIQRQFAGIKAAHDRIRSLELAHHTGQ